MAYYEKDYLAHHGIVGQKWGIRRFQNADGTLTEKGKKRRNLANESERRRNRPPESKSWKSNEASYLTDEELRRRNSRLQQERQYSQLTESKGKKFARSAGNLAKSTGKWIGSTTNKIFVASLIGVLGGVMASAYKDTIAKRGADFVRGLMMMNADWNNVKMWQLGI